MAETVCQMVEAYMDGSQAECGKPGRWSADGIVMCDACKAACDGDPGLYREIVPLICPTPGCNAKRTTLVRRPRPADYRADIPYVGRETLRCECGCVYFASVEFGAEPVPPTARSAS